MWTYDVPCAVKIQSLCQRPSQERERLWRVEDDVGSGLIQRRGDGVSTGHRTTPPTRSQLHQPAAHEPHGMFYVEIGTPYMARLGSDSLRPLIKVKPVKHGLHAFSHALLPMVPAGRRGSTWMQLQAWLAPAYFSAFTFLAASNLPSSALSLASLLQPPSASICQAVRSARGCQGSCRPSSSAACFRQGLFLQAR